MAGEEAYYNPIIRSMVESAQLQQHAQALQQQKEFQTGELQNRQRLADLHEKQLQQQHDQFMEHLNKVLVPQVKAAAEAERLKNMNTARQLITSGMSPEAFRQPAVQGILPGAGSFTVPGTPEGMINVPGVGLQPQSAYPTTSQSAALEAQRVKGIATAQHEAAEPFEERKETRQHINKMFEAAQHGADQIHLANVHGHYQESVARINGANHLEGIRMTNMMGIDEDPTNVKNIVDEIYSGQTAFTSLPPAWKKAVTAYTAGTGEQLPTDNKGYFKKLDTIGSMQELLSTARDIAKKYSVDSPGASSKGNQSLQIPLYGRVKRTKPGSEMEKQLDSLKSMGGSLATQFDQQNRKSDAEILRSVTGVFNPRATVQQNLDAINSHVRQMQQTVRNTFAGMKPERINKVLGDRGITDFGAFSYQESSIAPTKYGKYAVGPNNHVIGTNDNGKTWFDAQTGQAVQ